MPETPATTPWYSSRVFVTTAIGIITGLPALAQQIQAIDFIPTPVKNTLIVTSVICLWLAPLLNRQSAEAMGKRLEDQTTAVHAQVGEVATATANHLDPHVFDGGAEVQTLRDVANDAPKEVVRP